MVHVPSISIRFRFFFRLVNLAPGAVMDVSDTLDLTLSNLDKLLSMFET